MSRTILFYNAYITLNGNKTSINLFELIDNIYLLDDVEKYWGHKNISMLFLNNVDPNYANNRSFALAKYRENYRPYTGRVRTNRATPITDDVIEFTCCSYIHDARTLMIEYNHFGCRTNDVANYLSSFLPQNETEHWDVCLEPIPAIRGIETIRLAQKINSVEFNIDCTQTLPVNFPAQTLFGSLIQRSVQSHIDFGANNAIFKFTNGRRRNEIIQVEMLIPLIQLLDVEAEVYNSVKVEFTNNNGQKDTIDLKNGNILKEVIMSEVDIDGYQAIINNMEREYINRRNPGSNAHTRYPQLLRNRILPGIIRHRLLINEENGLLPEVGV